MSKFTGRAYVSIPGFGRVPSEKGATLEMGGITKEAVATDFGIEGFKDGDPQPAKVSISIHHKKGLSVTALRDFEGNIDFETDTGVSFKLIECVAESPPALSAGMISVDYLAVRCEEQA